jgi:hypothetical protein
MSSAKALREAKSSLTVFDERDSFIVAEFSNLVSSDSNGQVVVAYLPVASFRYCEKNDFASMLYCLNLVNFAAVAHYVTPWPNP